jgi:hypothetical protein
MIRYFCDGCGEELTEAVRGPRNDQGRLYANVPVSHGKVLHVEIFTGMGNQSAADRVGTVALNGGEWCRVCIATAAKVAVSRTAEAATTNRGQA